MDFNWQQVLVYALVIFASFSIGNALGFRQGFYEVSGIVFDVLESVGMKIQEAEIEAEKEEDES